MTNLRTTSVCLLADYATGGLPIDSCFNPAGGLLAKIPLGGVAGGPRMTNPEHRIASNRYHLDGEKGAVSVIFIDTYQVGRTIVNERVKVLSPSDAEWEAAPAALEDARVKRFGPA